MEPYVHAHIISFAVPLNQTHQEQSRRKTVGQPGTEEMIDKISPRQVDIVVIQDEFSNEAGKRSKTARQFEFFASSAVKFTPSILRLSE